MADSNRSIPAEGSMSRKLINPHNPEFITKKPWYLSDGVASNNQPTLDHQTDQRPENKRATLTLGASEQLLHDLRRKQKKQASLCRFVVGQWVEALQRNKLPYKICQITSINYPQKNVAELDLKFEDGTVERRVQVGLDKLCDRVRFTKSGNRSTTVEDFVVGKETYDGKRDKYHGYDRDTHNTVINAKYQKRQRLRKEIREDHLEHRKKRALELSCENDKSNSPDLDSDFDDSDIESDHENSSDCDGEFVQRDEDAKVITSRLARQGGVGGAQMKVTARNLRIREDTAKYLRNLDPNSAYYDPKSRSMRDNPNPSIPVMETDYAGDNFVRISGDASSLAQTQLFAWEAFAKTGTISAQGMHPQANPSQAEMLKIKFQAKVLDTKIQQKRLLLDKYGGEQYLDGSMGLDSAMIGERNVCPGRSEEALGASIVDRNLRFGVSSEQQQYSRDGRLLKSGEMTNMKKVSRYHIKPSLGKYEEDIYQNGHTSVWGSYFHPGAFNWGYHDDHSLFRNSYCTGAVGRIANDEANLTQYGNGTVGSAELAQARKIETCLNVGKS